MLKPLQTIADKLRSGLVKRTLVYTFSASLNALVAFILLPVLTKYLSPFDYGVVETFLAVSACLTVIILFGGNTLLSKHYFVMQRGEINSYASNILGVIFFTTCCLLSVYLLFSQFSDYFSELLKIDRLLILLAIITALANSLISLVLTLFQLEKAPGHYALFANTKTVIDISISLFCVVLLGMTWQGRITGIFITAIIYAVIALIVFKYRSMIVAFPRQYGKLILITGFPLMLAQATGWVIEMIDKIMVTSIINIESTGIYSIGYRFGMVVMMVEVAFSQAWLPFFYETIKDNTEESNLKIVKATYMYLAGLLVFSVVFAFFGKYLLFLMVDPKFYSASKFIFLISIAYFFDGIWKMFIGYLVHAGKTKTYSNIVIVSAVVNVVLNYIFLKRYGVIGSAWATLISFAFGAVATGYCACRIYPMPWRLGFNRVKGISS